MRQNAYCEVNTCSEGVYFHLQGFLSKEHLKMKVYTFGHQNLRTRAVDLDHRPLGRSKNLYLKFFFYFSLIRLSSDVFLDNTNLQKYSVLSDDITTNF